MMLLIAMCVVVVVVMVMVLEYVFEAQTHLSASHWLKAFAQLSNG